MHWSRFASAAGICLVFAACTESPTTPNPRAERLGPLFSRDVKGDRGPVDMFMGNPFAHSAGAAALRPTVSAGGLLGVLHADADIDCRAVFTSLTTCRETYALEAESNQGVTRAEGHVRGRRVANDGSTTTVYELDARVDCLTIQPFAASAAGPAGVEIWASGPVRTFTVNGKPQPVPFASNDLGPDNRQPQGPGNSQNNFGHSEEHMDMKGGGGRPGAVIGNNT